MGIIDKLLGREEPAQNIAQGGAQPGFAQGGPGSGAPQGGQAQGGQAQPMDADAQAVARYRYMLQTAPPDQIEAAHAEAFARLTPEQRRLALQQISQAVPENERASLQDDPRSLAQAATRAEIRQPGTLQNAFGSPQGQQMGQPGGMMGGMGGGGLMGGMGGMLAGSLLASVAGGFIGSSIANSFFSNPAHESGFMQDAQAQGLEPASYGEATGDPYLEQPGHDSMGDPADAGSQGFQEAGHDSLGDPGASDAGGFDSGGFDGGDFGGDFGGGFDI